MIAPPQAFTRDDVSPAQVAPVSARDFAAFIFWAADILGMRLDLVEIQQPAAGAVDVVVDCDPDTAASIAGVLRERVAVNLRVRVLVIAAGSA